MNSRNADRSTQNINKVQSKKEVGDRSLEFIINQDDLGNDDDGKYEGFRFLELPNSAKIHELSSIKNPNIHSYSVNKTGLKLWNQKIQSTNCCNDQMYSVSGKSALSENYKKKYISLQTNKSKGNSVEQIVDIDSAYIKNDGGKYRCEDSIFGELVTAMLKKMSQNKKKIVKKRIMNILLS